MLVFLIVVAVLFVLFGAGGLTAAMYGIMLWLSWILCPWYITAALILPGIYYIYLWVQLQITTANLEKMQNQIGEFDDDEDEDIEM